MCSFNRAPPRSGASSTMHPPPIFMRSAKKTRFFDQSTTLIIMHFPAGGATSLRLCTSKLIWGGLVRHLSDCFPPSDPTVEFPPISKIRSQLRSFEAPNLHAQGDACLLWSITTNITIPFTITSPNAIAGLLISATKLVPGAVRDGSGPGRRGGRARGCHVPAPPGSLVDDNNGGGSPTELAAGSSDSRQVGWTPIQERVNFSPPPQSSS